MQERTVEAAIVKLVKQQAHAMVIMAACGNVAMAHSAAACCGAAQQNTAAQLHLQNWSWSST